MVQAGGVLVKVQLVHHGEKNLLDQELVSQYKEWVIRQCELNLDSSLINKNFVYKELDEKIMLGLRLREGIDIYDLFREQNWENKKFDRNLRKLLVEWKNFLDSGLLVRKGNRFFLSEPKGMELSNQILVSMFKWWDEIN